ncbi:MAG: hypothetical protein R2910_12930 [Gemmatimonadales bacterium]
MRRSIHLCIGLGLLAVAHLSAQSTPTTKKPTKSPDLTVSADVASAIQANEALARKIGTISAPPPITSTNALRGLDVTPSQLKAGRSVRFTPEALQSRDGYLTLWDVTLIRGRSNKYVGYAAANSPGRRGGATIDFEAPPGHRYLVDFAVEGEHAGYPDVFNMQLSICGSRTQQVESDAGHIAILVSQPTARRCQVSLSRRPYDPTRRAYDGWTFFYVEVTPLP